MKKNEKKKIPENQAENVRKRRSSKKTNTDAVAVIGDLDELEAAVLDDDVYGGGAGVETVLNELFDGGDRALDNLAGGDSVHYRIV